jgi:hypothetical protein
VILALALLACGPVDPDTFLADSGTTNGTTETGETGVATETGETGDTAPPVDTEPVPLELCINEFMPDNKTALFLDDGTAPDWIELHNPSAEPVDLVGWSLTDDPDEPDKHALHSDLAIPAGGFMLFYADGIDDVAQAQHLSFKLTGEGGSVGLFAPDGRGQLVHHGLVETDFSLHRLQDCCTDSGCLDFDFRGTPGTTNDPPIPVEQTLLELGQDWLYHALPEAPPNDWQTLAFDDGTWPAGTAPLGAGDTHITTSIDIGPDGDRRATTYFRRTFELDDLAGVQGLILQLVVDDGALVWLNETEVVRSNMAAGAVTHDTWALSAVGDAAEYTPADWVLPPDGLVVGTNLLAVEVHQAAATSSDLTFDLGVVVEVVEVVD